MSKHGKDHEVKIKSRVSWRKLTGLKKEDRKKEIKKQTSQLSLSQMAAGTSQRCTHFQ